MPGRARRQAARATEATARRTKKGRRESEARQHVRKHAREESPLLEDRSIFKVDNVLCGDWTTSAAAQWKDTTNLAIKCPAFSLERLPTQREQSVFDGSFTDRSGRYFLAQFRASCHEDFNKRVAFVPRMFPIGCRTSVKLRHLIPSSYNKLSSARSPGPR